MTSDEIKALAMRFIDRFNSRDRAALDELIAPEYVQHSPGVPPSRAALTVFIDGVFRAFSDGHFVVHDAIAEGNKVLMRWTFHGTHDGSWMGQPPTGKKIAFDGMDLWRYNDDGRLAEAWFMSDNLGLMQQLGRIPSFGPRRS